MNAQQNWPFAGIDGCKAGWWVWLTDGQGQWSGHLYPTIAEFWHQHGGSLNTVLIDMPIGLMPDGPESQRPVDRWAKMHLPGRKSSIFSPPARSTVKAILTKDDYRHACSANRIAVGKNISQQAFHISFKIKALDAFLKACPPAQTVLGETHPELAFRYLGAGQVPPPKKSPEGLAARKKLLAPRVPHLPALLSTARAQYLKKEVQDDDLLDALALAVLAAQPLQSYPTDFQVDETGRPMRMVLPQDFEAVVGTP